LESPFIFVPHDCIVPGSLTAGDLCDVAAALAPRPLVLADLVDGVNRAVAAERIATIYAPTRAAYQAMGAGDSLVLNSPEKTKDFVSFFTTALAAGN
jgi:hypothetical protein